MVVFLMTKFLNLFFSVKWTLMWKTWPLLRSKFANLNHAAILFSNRNDFLLLTLSNKLSLFSPFINVLSWNFNTSQAIWGQQNLRWSAQMEEGLVIVSRSVARSDLVVTLMRCPLVKRCLDCFPPCVYIIIFFSLWNDGLQIIWKDW